MAYGTQAAGNAGRHRIIPPSQPRNGHGARPAAESDGDARHPTGNWRARVMMAARNDGKRTIAEQVQELKARIVRWLRQEGLHSEVARIDPLDGRIAVLVICSSRCKHRLRTAFPDLEVTSGATRVSHCT